MTMKRAIPAALLGLAAVAAAAGPQPCGAEGRYGDLPLQFIRNDGLAHSSLKYMARGKGYGVAVNERGAIVTVVGKSPKGSAGSVSFGMRTVGARPDARVVALGKLPGTVSSFVGGRAAWRTGIPTYSSVLVKRVYQGIDLLYRGNQTRIEYDFVVAPGADPSSIRVAMDGLRGASVDAAGNLRLTTRLGTITKTRPTLYQTVNGKRVTVAGGFRPIAGRRSEFGFAVGRYDRRRELVIDPIFQYSTLVGAGADERGGGIAVDGAGSAYITGNTASPTFPVTAGAFDVTYNANIDAFVTKLNPTGTAQVYSAFLGGVGPDDGVAVTLDDTGAAYVVGRTGSPNFPTDPGAPLPAFSGGLTDGFVTKIAPAGNTIVYSTYLGGSQDDGCTAIALSMNHAAYVTGFTKSPNFPISATAFDTTFNGNYDAFVSVITPAGGAIPYSTYFGGAGEDSGMGIDTIDIVPVISGYTESPAFPTSQGAFQTVRLGPSDAFAARFTFDLAAVSWSTLVGGSAYDLGAGLVLNAKQEPAFTGYTESTDFPVTGGAADSTLGGARDGIAVHLAANGAALIGSTFLGGSSADEGRAIAITSQEEYVVAGLTGSPDFPVTPGAAQPVFGGTADAFAARLAATCTAIPYGTFIGGGLGEEGNGVAVDGSDSVYVSGTSASPNFPTTPGAFQVALAGGTDAFVAKLGMLGPTSVGVAAATGKMGSPAVLKAVLRRLSDGAPLAGETLSFTVDGTAAGSAATNTSGEANVTFPIIAPITLGAHTVDATFGGSPSFLASTGSGILTVTEAPTSVFVIDRSAIITELVILRGYLRRTTDLAWLVGRPLTFKIDGVVVGTGTTNASGMGSFSWIVPVGPASRAITVEYAGETYYLPSAGTATLSCLTVATKAHVLDRTGDIGSDVLLRGYLYTVAGTVPIAGKGLDFQVDGTAVGSAVTSAAGRAQLWYTIADGSGAGARTIRVDWAGDGGYLASFKTAKLTANTASVYLVVASRSAKVGVPVNLRGFLRRLPDYQYQAGRTLDFAIDGTYVGSGVTSALGTGGMAYTAPAGTSLGAHTIQCDFAGDAWLDPGVGLGTLNIVP